ncbi:MAG: beta-galactosidase [Exilibacterium sp.]
MMTRRDIIRTLGALGIGSVGTVLGGCQHLDAASPKPRFQVAGNKFMLDGSPFQMRAGEMHYPRIPRALWRDRMRKLKSLGLNTLSTYVFWNAHEKTPGQFDFSGNLDISAFLRHAREVGLWVNLRPGPYSNSGSRRALVKALGTRDNAPDDFPGRPHHSHASRE